MLPSRIDRVPIQPVHLAKFLSIGIKKIDCLKRHLTLWLAIALLACTGGCARGLFGKNRTRGESDFQTQIPGVFSQAGELHAPNRWWTSFGDPKLDGHVEQALERNFDLAAALQRLGAARAIVRREASDLFPDIDGVADFASTFGPGDDATNYRVGFSASYQVDLWGQIQSRVDAEAFRAHATSADYQTVALTLAAEVARTWFSLIEAHAQLELLQEQIETNRTGLELQESRFGLGLIRSPDVLRQRQLVESTREQEVVVRSSIEILEHRLAVLLGGIPQDAHYKPRRGASRTTANSCTGTPLGALETPGRTYGALTFSFRPPIAI